MKIVSLIFLFTCCALFTKAQEANYVSKVWAADSRNGTYKNPIIHADYSDPDAIRVGHDFYMISSSFNALPGIPILHSTDLVNWSLIGHALSKQFPSKDFDSVQHGNGVWAPSLRFHKGIFYIFYPDPDRGIFLIKSKIITGPWSNPILVEEGKGLIDPCPLWDDNGKVYLVHAYAGSRAGFKSLLVVKELNAGADKIIGNAVMVYDGHKNDVTVEGPKLYKRNNYYYIFAPAGGVGTGWQIVLRAKNIYGPYERKIVMQQGRSDINGPHQGAWINTALGEDWFIHFQDKDAYGRVVHLQPMIWKNDWPVIGTDADGDGIGEPVTSFKKPKIKIHSTPSSPQEADEFNFPKLGLQWQWQANPKEGWAYPSTGGFLTMFCIRQPDSLKNYWMLPNIISQKIPAEECSVITKLAFRPQQNNEKTGLILFGTDYAFIGLVKKESGIFITYNFCMDADKGKQENEKEITKTTAENIWLQLKINKNSMAVFSYSEDGILFTSLQETFKAKPGKWVGAKIGLFSTASIKTNNSGYVNIDWFRIIKSI
jgi:beta-xylosidase